MTGPSVTMTSNDFRGVLEVLRSQLVWRLSHAVILFGIAGAWYQLVRRDLPFGHVLIPFATILIARVAQVTNAQRPRFSRRFLVSGILATLLLAMLAMDEPVLPYLGIPAVFLSALIVSRGGLISSAAIAACALLLNLLGVRHYPLMELSVTLVLAAGASGLSAYTLFMAIHWYSDMQARTQELLEAARDHRAELSRTVKSLQLAYETQHQIQLELIQARKVAEDARRSKEQFAANISHELWTPLNLIVGFSEVMYLSPDVYGDMTWPPGLRRDIHQIYRNSQHLLGMMRDVLDLSRFEMNGYNISLETVDIAALLHESLDIAQYLIKGHAVRLELNIVGALPPLEIDRTRIRQVVLNLLSNAYRFTQAGLIEISARRVEREVTISVRDTGQGIPADQQARLFDEVFQGNTSIQRTHGGAGLGLAISKRFVEAHGGRIWAESREGEGSCFTFSLPISERYLAQSVRGGDGRLAEGVAARARVLLVETDHTVVSLVRHHLADYDVIQVEDGGALHDWVVAYQPRAIIHNARPNQAGAIGPDVLDMGVPLIECTLPSAEWVAAQLGVSACLTKPITHETLAHELARFGEVHSLLLLFSDREFPLLLERLIQMTDKALTVQRAYAADQALLMLDQHRPDLIVLDHAMLDNGAWAQVRADWRALDIPVLLVTTNQRVESMWEGSRLSVHQRDGLFPSEVLHGLRAVIEGLKPRPYISAPRVRR
ncbi:MAG: hybrid sensor histidine kinase/response regulator [Anaerolineae bacterium]|nr:hybrid sensor histidine kinase/response regulator [Anaerolineae bacterium]